MRAGLLALLLSIGISAQAAVIETVHVVAAPHPETPVQPPNDEPPAAAAVSVTLVPWP